ncbi:unnamed protein product [Brachionus calyciflorus]|uniref:E3 ubiquitin-protein ligase SHPRH n=1 Tax=Brachionus calyciflorus TaxID=104777 RepID=A0A813XUN9_9BILA|nr:unnamed protein product [Brachionus calyciflorus]
MPRYSQKSGKENKPDRPPSPNIFNYLANESDNSDLMDFTEDEDEIDNKKADTDYRPSKYKRKYTPGECSSNNAMSENVNILNRIDSDEPLIKKRHVFTEEKNLDSKYLTDQTFIPYHKIFYKNILTDLEIIGQIHLKQIDLYKNFDVVKLKTYGKGKRESPEETIVRFQEKRTQYNENTQSEVLFHVSDHQMHLHKIGFNTSDLTNDNTNFNFLVYESLNEYSSQMEDGFCYASSSNPSKRYKKLLESYDREHFILITNHYSVEQTNQKAEYNFFKAEKNELNSTILRLLSNKYIGLVLNKIEDKSNSLVLNLSIFLNEKCRQDEIIESNPSFTYLNSKSVMDIHYLMTHFYLSRINLQINHRSFFDNKQSDECFDVINKNADEITNRNENLFDLIYELHKNSGDFNELIGCSDDTVIQNLSSLKPDLRPYQINAIKWMLFKENFNFKKTRRLVDQDPSEIHPLYVKLNNEKGDVIYYHKYFGVFTKKEPLRLKSLPGGILADEMGLGKTLEILTLIMINTRNDNFTHEFVSCKIEKSRKDLNKNSFSCLCGNTPESFQIDTYKRNKHEKDKSIYQCVACSVWTHIECVNYNGKKDEFLCLECCTKVPPIKSGCTLIVTPSIISHQWADEIKKHVDKKLKVHVYKGTSGGFIQPKDLASLDICITTYDVLSNELAHVFAIENQRSLRKAKRFSNIPSPLICVEWWRICLDEAQMVHSTNSRCAEMANRLKAINRWCVTGTPIGRSLADLHGLFAFIREDPYLDKKWFKYCLFETFQSGDKMPMAKAVSNVLWRTAKRYVEDQINIPKQTEICYWLDFSPFEAHLYQRVLEIFRQNRKNSFISQDLSNQISVQQDINNNTAEEKDNVDHFFSKYLNGNIRLDEVERAVIDQLLAPLIDLRLACSHPQLVLRKRTFMAQNTMAKKKEKLLTMEKSLQILMKKTQNECDNIFRSLTMHSNAIAGLHILNNDVPQAITTYQQILDSENDYNSNVNLDLIQKVHTYHNYIDVLKMDLDRRKNAENLTEDAIENIQSQIELLRRKLKDCENSYKLAFDEKKTKDEAQFNKTRKDIDKKHNLKSQKESKYLVILIDFLEQIKSNEEFNNDFWDQLSKEFAMSTYFERTDRDEDDEESNIESEDDDELNNLVKTSYTFCGRTIKTINELELVFTNEFDQVIDRRDKLIEQVEDISGEIGDDLVSKSADCHLRHDLNNHRITKKSQKCKICKFDQALNSYAKHLFSNSLDTIKIFNPRSNKNESDEEFEQEDFQLNRMTSDLEKLIKLINWYCKSKKNLVENFEQSKELLDFYNSLKIEFQHSRQYWTSLNTLINSMDELDMAKTRLRLLQPGEKLNQKFDYIIEPSMINTHFIRHQTEQRENRIALGKKLGQLIYLQQSSKTFNLVDNQENTEPCPICQCNLGFEWFILSCGHLFCKECYEKLLNSENSFVNNSKRYVRCALCRENCPHEESHLVSTKKIEELSQVEPDSKLTNVEQKSFLNEYKNVNPESIQLKSVKIKGECNSAKVEGIVKCLVKILQQDRYSKCIVFSEQLIMLDLIIDLLKDNSISFAYVKDNYSLQKKIDEFKKNSDCNVLLMPYSFGANGLNIIEATHVLLVEPTLNKSQEVQAIGRVHRIGQTRPTFVYRFMIKNSIEEHVFSMFKANTSYSSSEKTTPNFDKPMCSKSLAQLDQQKENKVTTLTVNDLKKLFLSL